MISRVRSLGSKAASSVVWSQLRLFCHSSICSERIYEINGIPKDSHQGNIRKQAEQLGYCIRQAEQYFNAAATSSVVVRPNLLYYGAVSLCRAVILMRKNGDFSIDQLRNLRRHQHHGLNMVVDSSLRSSRDTDEFFSRLGCKIHLNNDAPWGQFALFYESVVPPASITRVEVGQAGTETILEYFIPLVARVPTLQSIQYQQFSPFSLLRLSPCLSPFFDEGRAKSLLRPFKILAKIRKNKPIIEAEIPTLKQLSKSREQLDLFINRLFDSDRQFVKELFRNVSPDFSLMNEFANSLHYRLVREYTDPANNAIVRLPNIVDDMEGNLFIALDESDLMPEPCRILLLMYIFGMLARYYPDIWVRTVDHNIHLREVLSVFLADSEFRFPLLILDQLTSVKHYFG